MIFVSFLAGLRGEGIIRIFRPLGYVFTYVYKVLHMVTSSADLTIRRPFSERTFVHQSIKRHAYSHINYHHDVFYSRVFHISYKNTLQFNVPCVSLRHSRLLTPKSSVNLVHNLSFKRRVFTPQF